MNNKTKKVGLFTLGITLILVGTAIILARYTQIEFLKDTFLLWPAFLILLGLEFIFSKLYYDFKQEEVHLSPSGFSIFLAIVILLVSFFWTNGVVNFPKFNLNFNNNIIQSYSSTVEDTFKLGDMDVSSSKHIKIDNIRGSVDIQPSANDKFSLEAKVKIATNKEEDAKALIPEIINVDNGTTLMVVSHFNQSNDHSLQYVNLTIRIPETLTVDVKTGYGDVRISEIKNDVKVEQRYSRIYINDIVGDVTLDNKYGDVSVEAIDGDLTIVNAYGAVDVKNITGKADIENSYNPTKVKSIGKDAVVFSKYGLVLVEDIGGNAKVENSYSNTSCYNIEGNLNLSAKYSTVNIENVNGDIDAETSYNSLNLTNKSFSETDIKATTTYSSIKGDKDVNLSVNNDKNLAEASAFNGSGSQKIRLKNKYGDIRIER